MQTITLETNERYKHLEKGFIEKFGHATEYENGGNCTIQFFSAAGSSDRVQLTAGRNLQKESLEKLQETMQTQSEMQQELLEEISKNIRELSKGVQKGKFGLFR